MPVCWQRCNRRWSYRSCRSYCPYLNVSIDDAAWLVTVTLLSAAIATPILSRLADMYGKKRLFLLTLILMMIGSLLAAVSGLNYWPVLIGRALQGLADASIPIGISIMRDELPSSRLPGAIAIMSATMGVGAGLGLPLSGVLYDAFGWSSLFVVTAVWTAVVIVAVALLVRESPDAQVGSLTFPEHWYCRWRSARSCLHFPRVVPGAGTARSYWVCSHWRQLPTAQPLLDLRSAGSRPILLTNLASVLIGFSMFVNMLVTTQLLQQPPESGAGLGLPVVYAGLAMMPSAFMMLVMAPFSGSLIRRYGGRSTLLLGALVMGLAYVFRVFWSGSVALVIIGSAVVGIGSALTYAAMPSIIMSVARRDETAAANGLNALMRSIGTSISSAALGTILASFTVVIGGDVFASAFAFRLVLLISALAALLGAVLAWAIPPALQSRNGI